MITKFFEKIFNILPNLVVYGGLIILLLDDSIHTFFEVKQLIPIEVRISLLIAVIASLTWTLSLHIKKVDLSIEELGKWKWGEAEIINLWGEIDLAQKYKDATKIKILNLAGTQFARLGSQRNLDAIFNLDKLKEVEILVGDPYGEGVKLRYTPGFGEPSTYETGLTGINRRLKDLFKRWNQLPDKYKNKIKIRVFSIYPTISLIQIDYDYYSAIYGYELRGGDCPKIHTVSGSPYSNFLDKHFENVFNVSLPLEEWIKKHSYNEYNKNK